MSRHTITTGDGKKVAYGLDEIPYPGYFLQVFEPEKEAESGAERPLAEDYDTRAVFSENPASRTKIAERLQELGGPEEHVKRILSDLPV